MLENLKSTSEVLSLLQECKFVMSDEEKRQTFVQSLNPSWNGYIGIHEGTRTFEAMVSLALGEALRGKQLEARAGTATPKLIGRVSMSQKADKLNKARCYKCKKFGHFAFKCTKSKRSQSSETANYIELGVCICGRVRQRLYWA